MAPRAVSVLMLVKPVGSGSEIYIDGQRLENVKSVKISEITVDTLVTMQIELVNVDLEVRGEIGQLDITPLDAQTRKFA